MSIPKRIAVAGGLSSLGFELARDLLSHPEVEFVLGVDRRAPPWTLEAMRVVRHDPRDPFGQWLLEYWLDALVVFSFDPLLPSWAPVLASVHRAGVTSLVLVDVVSGPAQALARGRTSLEAIEAFRERHPEVEVLYVVSAWPRALIGGGLRRGSKWGDSSRDLEWAIHIDDMIRLLRESLEKGVQGRLLLRAPVGAVAERGCRWGARWEDMGAGLMEAVAHRLGLRSGGGIPTRAALENELERIFGARDAGHLGLRFSAKEALSIEQRICAGAGGPLSAGRLWRHRHGGA